MKIGLDLRLTIKSNSYSEFLLILIETLLDKDTTGEYIIYSNHKLNIKFTEKSKNVLVEERPGTFEEQISLRKIFNREKFSLMIFFNHKKPIFYKGKYLLFIPSLEELFFTTENFFGRIKYNFLMNSSIKNCKKLICFDKNTSIELNERLNVKENLIDIISPFFVTKFKYELNDSLKIDVKAKYNLKNDYFIYDGNNKPNSNLSKLFKAIRGLKNKGIIINLFILSEETNSDLGIREEALSYNIQDSIFFIGSININDEFYYYKQSIGVIYPSIYTSFPFSLNKAIKYEIPIIASNIPAIKNSIGNNLITFNPLSSSDLQQKIETFLTEQKKIDYSSIENNLNKGKTAEQLKKIIYENIYDI